MAGLSAASAKGAGAELAAEKPRVASRWMGAWLLLILTCIYAINFADRTLLGFLQQPIKAELKLTDWEFGALGGTVFSVVYTFVALYSPTLVRRFGRTKVLASSIVIWSAVTMLCALVRTLPQFFLLRMAVAVGEGGATPVSHSLLSSQFPPEKRASAFAIFHAGPTFGMMIAASIAGLVGSTWGWRWAFVVAGIPGLILAPLFYLTIKDRQPAVPVEPAAEATQSASLLSVLRVLIVKPTFRNMLAGASLSTFIIIALMHFVTAFFMRTHQFSLADAGLISGIGGGIVLGIGSILGGFAAQKLAAGRNRSMIFLTPALLTFAAAPCLVLAFLAPGATASITGFLLAVVLLASFNGPVFGSVHSLVEPNQRVAASAILLTIANMLGAGLGPLMAGLASDLFAQHYFGAADYQLVCDKGTSVLAACKDASARGLAASLLCFAPLAVWAAIHYRLAARAIREDVVD